ncbi:DUF3871 family protein [Aquirufa sp. ROCK2-A2]
MSNQIDYLEEVEIVSSSSAFIEANTIEVSLQEIERHHIVPSYTKDYEPFISVGDFVNRTKDVLHHYLDGETILAPAIRVSHPIKGRVPEARFKPTSELLENEKTVYYERTMFLFEIPSITSSIDGQPMNLIVGGIKAYNEDKINGKKGSLESFKLFIGFQVKVCSNLAVWTDGAVVNVKVRSIGELMDHTMQMLNQYHPKRQIQAMESLLNYSLTESQLAPIIGRARLYNYLPIQERKGISDLLFTDSQINAVAKDYYQDESFCRGQNGEISLWRLYNLLTGANKSSYIDQFASRALNASNFVQQLQNSLDEGTSNWFLN